MFVKNWQEVWKSLAVWFPFIIAALDAFLRLVQDSQLVPTQYLPLVILLSSAVGWIVKQNNIKKDNYENIN